MAEKVAVLVDVSLCTGCRGCQVACKQWNRNPASKTCFVGTYENPPDLEWNTFTRVTFKEQEKGGKLAWLFRKTQCRHCLEPGCLDAEPTTMEKLDNGIVYSDRSKTVTKQEFENIKNSCPYDVPRYEPESKTVRKCTLCNDRLESGWEPACVTACLSGALVFGKRDVILKEANKRLGKLKKKYPDAQLVGDEDWGWIYLLLHDEEEYGFKFGPVSKEKATT
jgi:formate dehydrogenase iron-sulfur subunit